MTTLQEIKDYLESDGVKTIFNETPALKTAYEAYQAEMNKIADKHREMTPMDVGVLQALITLQEKLNIKQDVQVQQYETPSVNLTPEDLNRKKVAAALFGAAQQNTIQAGIQEFLRNAVAGVNEIQVAMPVPAQEQSSTASHDELSVSVRSDNSTLEMTDAFNRHRPSVEQVEAARQNNDKIASKEDITEAVLPGKNRNRDAADAFTKKLENFDLKKLMVYRAEFYNRVLGDLIKRLEGPNHNEYRHNAEYIEAKNALVGDPVFSVMQTLIREKANIEKKNVPIFEAEKVNKAPESPPRGRSGLRGMIDRVRRSPSPESRKTHKEGLDIFIPDNKRRGPGRGK